MAALFFNRGGGWHNMAQGDMSGEIGSVFFQRVPDSDVGRIWVTMDKIPVCYDHVLGDPREYSGYKFNWEGWLELGWMYAGMRDIEKIYKSLKAFGDKLDSSNFVDLFYKEDDDTTWTKVSGSFDTTPSEELTFNATRYLKAKRLRIGLRFRSTDVNDSPEIEALTVDAFGLVEPKDAITVPILVKDNLEEQDLTGQSQSSLGYATTSAAALADLKTLVTTGALDLTSHVAALDGKTVALQPIRYKPRKILGDIEYEEYILELQFLEI